MLLVFRVQKGGFDNLLQKKLSEVNESSNNQEVLHPSKTGHELVFNSQETEANQPVTYNHAAYIDKGDHVDIESVRSWNRSFINVDKQDDIPTERIAHLDGNGEFEVVARSVPMDDRTAEDAELKYVLQRSLYETHGPCSDTVSCSSHGPSDRIGGHRSKSVFVERGEISESGAFDFEMIRKSNERGQNIGRKKTNRRFLAHLQHIADDNIDDSLSDRNEENVGIRGDRVSCGPEANALTIESVINEDTDFDSNQTDDTYTMARERRKQRIIGFKWTPNEKYVDMSPVDRTDGSGVKRKSKQFSFFNFKAAKENIEINVVNRSEGTEIQHAESKNKCSEIVQTELDGKEIDGFGNIANDGYLEKDDKKRLKAECGRSNAVDRF